LTAGTYLSGTAYNGSAAQTWTVDATSANTASKVVARDASGNFSAGTITAALTGNLNGGTLNGPLYTATYDNSSKVMFNSGGSYYLGLTGNVSTGGGSLSMVQYSNPDGTAAHAVNSYPLLHSNNYNSYAPTLTGTGASGTWSINVTGSSASCTGNAATASNASLLNSLSKIQMWNNSGQNHGTYQSFADIPNFGVWYMQNSAAGDSPQSGYQYYVQTQGLGNEYAYSSYALMTAIARSNATMYTFYRTREGGTWGSWIKASAGYADTAGSVDFANLTNKASGTGTYTTSGDYRAPIFYDSNDTGYYVDPNGTSNLNVSAFGRAYAGYDAGQSSSFSCSNWFRSSGNTGWYNASYAVGIYAIDSTWVRTYNSAQFYSDTIIQAGASVRAPIFYDSNNTGYYVDPNGTSNFAGLTVSSTISGSVSGSSNYTTTNYVGGQQLNPQTYFNNGVGLKVAMTAVAGYWSDTLWINGYSGGDVLSMCALHTQRNGQPRMYISSQQSTASSYGTLYEFPTYGNNYNSGALYAGIFYDSDNTGYYVDPASTSNVNQFQSDRTYGFSDIRSPIFYDYNNTGYYVDPASTSNINIVNAAGTCTFSGTVNFTNGSTYSAFMYGQGNTASVSGTGMNVYSTGGNGAVMAFHRGGYYAVNFGLDSDNVIRIGGWSASANRLQMDMSGNLTMAGNVTAYSDERLKKDWALLPDSFIESLAQLKSGTYTRIDSDERQAGISAQGLQKFLPEVVQTDASDTLSVNYGSAAMVSAVELAKEVVDLRARVAQLESLVNKLIGD